MPATTTAEDRAQQLERERAQAHAREQVTVRCTPKGPLSDDVEPYMFTCTRKAWLSGVYPAADGFELVTDDGLTMEERRARAVEQARRIVAEEEAAEAARLEQERQEAAAAAAAATGR